jgi:hypothetical protein
MTSSEGGLVAIVKSVIRDTDVGAADPETVAFRPLRVFRAENRFQNEGYA